MRVSLDYPGIAEAIAEGRVTGLAKGTPPPKRSKHGNTKVVIDGQTFDSKKEAARYVLLQQLVSVGGIFDLKTQVPFRLEVNGKLICKYIADFVYMGPAVGGPKLLVEDVKSAWTRKLPVYRIKLKLMKAIHDITIQEV